MWQEIGTHVDIQSTYAQMLGQATRTAHVHVYMCTAYAYIYSCTFETFFLDIAIMSTSLRTHRTAAYVHVLDLNHNNIRRITVTARVECDRSHQI